MNPLAGLKLRYRIGADDAPAEAGCVVEAPYGVRPPPGGIWYGNLFDQRDAYKRGQGEYGPYLNKTATSGHYNEGIVDPNGTRWSPHIEEQLAPVAAGETIEFDNQTDLAKRSSLAAVLGVFDLCAFKGVGAIAKNPGDLENGGALKVVSHRACVGIIVEKGAGSPDEMHALRVAAFKPELPVRFVAFGDGRAWAESMAGIIRAKGYVDMGVTFDSASDEYGGEITDILIPTKTAQPTTLTAGPLRIDLPGSIQNPAWSPDGTKLAFTHFYRGYNAAPSGIYIIDLATRELTTVIADGAENVNAPGAGWMLWSSDKSGHDEIYWQRPDGTTVQLTNWTGLAAWEPVWRSVGKSILFESHRDSDDEGPGQIINFDIASGIYTPITTAGRDCRQPNCSPDGRLIVFQENVGGDNWQLKLYDVAAGAERTLVAGTDATFSPDSQSIVYSDADGKLSTISITGGSPTRIGGAGYQGAPSWFGNLIACEASPSDPAGGAGTTLQLISVSSKAAPMPDTTAVTVTGAQIIAKARSYIGKFSDGPDVPRLAQEVGRRYPEMASYAALAGNGTAWCGIFVAKVLGEFGIRPPFGSDDVHRWMWVDAWLDWGTPIASGQEQPGDVAIFQGGPHHVTFVAGGGKYVGGNQGSAGEVSEERIRTPNAIRRAPMASAVVQPIKPSQQFERCMPFLLKDEGGNDDDPRDPGGRTSRGILQREWDVWRQTHPGLPSDVWQAPQDQVLAIYHEKYWDALLCDHLPAGVDYAVFDYGVNSGIGRSAKVLQRLVATDVDGEIGPLTIAATMQADPATLIGQICDERMAFLQQLGTWPTFGRGWTTRVNGVRMHALAMVGTVVQPPPVVISPPIQPPSPIQPVPSAPDEHVPVMRDASLILLLILNRLEKHMTAPGQSGVDLGKIFTDVRSIIRNPVVQKLMSGGAVTLDELLSLPRDARALLTDDSAAPVVTPALAPPADAPKAADPATVPAASTPAATAPPAKSILPGLAGGSVISGIIAALMGTGQMGTGFGLGVDPTTVGTVATIVGGLAPLVGAAGSGNWLSMGLKLLGLVGLQPKTK